MEYDTNLAQQEVHLATQEDGPADLEDALRRLRAGGGQTPAEDVGGAGVDEPGQGEPQQAEAIEEGVQGDPIEKLDPLPAVGGAETGGLADGDYGSAEEPGLGYSQEDYDSIQRTLADSVNRQAAMEANRFFKEQNIQQVSINELYQRDDRGRVTFMNPDDPDRPFTNRQEAQQWVDAYNSQVRQEWNRYASEVRNRYVNDTMPAVRLMQFAPVYDTMDKKAQEVMDAIIEPYSVRDSSGMVIGFSCDLSAAKSQAEKLCQMFGTPAAHIIDQPPVQPAASAPAMDMPSSGSSNPQNENDAPKDLNEAFKLLNRKRKEGNR